MSEPDLTRAQMIHTLRVVAPKASPVLRAAMLEVAASLERKEHVPGAQLRKIGAFGQVIDRLQQRMEREPGEEG